MGGCGSAGRISALAALATTVWCAASHAGPDLPDGFALVDPFPTTTFERPSQIAFLPDGRSLVAELSGIVWTLRPDGTRAPVPFVDLREEVLYAGFDTGLMSLAVDPEYPTEPWVYLLYTVDPDGDGIDDETDAFCRVTRYRPRDDDPEVADPATRHVLLGASWSDGIPTLSSSHTIGTLRFGEDGSLLVSAGDGAHFAGGVDAGGRDPDAFGPGRTDPSEDVGAFRARSLYSLAGKILRLDRRTGLGLPNNPYWDGNSASKRSRVWVYGLRNPYRFAVRPGTGSAVLGGGSPGTLYISDVGWDHFEELNVARDGGVNFGWPCAEGAGTKGRYHGVSSVETGNTNVLCATAPNPEVPDDESVPLAYYHHHDGSRSNPLGWTGRAATGGVFYTGTRYPSEYRGRFFAIEYVGWLRTIEVNADDEIVGWEDFGSDFFDHKVTSIEAHPVTGDLYIVQVFLGIIWRLVYGELLDVGTPTVAAPPRLVALRPNPSRGAVFVDLSLPHPGRVGLEVFDVRGTRVAATPPEDLPRGPSRLTWNGALGNGRPAAPGVYFLRIRSPFGHDTQRLVRDAP